MEDPRSLNTDTFCSVIAKSRSESLAGTAVTSTPLWIGLEHPGLWPRKPLHGSTLPEEVAHELSKWTAKGSGNRFQFLRRADSTPERIRLFVANTSPAEPWLVRFELNEPSELLDLGLLEPAGARHHPKAILESRPQIWVCTHGKRDRCCAKFGRALYDALLPLAPHDVWQSSHLGGHRFAPTLVTMPDGLCFGHVSPDEAESFWSAYQRNEIPRLDRLRGQVSYTAEQQVADAFLRHRHDLRHTASLGVPSTTHDEPSRCTVSFRGVDHEYTVQLEHFTPSPSIKSCSADATASPRWRVLSRASASAV